MGMSGALLAERLRGFHRAMLQRMDPADVEALRRAEDAIGASGVPGRALGVGQTAPDFTLPDQHGATVRLADRLALGPVVVVFYRGGWCPFCTLTLRAWQDALPGLHDAGGDLLAVSPEPARCCGDTAERDLLAYPLLSDRGNRVAESYGVAYEHPEVIRPLYLRLGHDLPRVNGTGDWRVPLPASFVVGRDGRVALSHAGATPWDRLEPAAAVELVRRLTG